MASEAAARHSSSVGVQKDTFDEMQAMDREYEFFVTTRESHQPNEKDRGRIRRVVMRNFMETRSKGNDNTSENNSNEAVQKRTVLKSKFRLLEPRQDGTEAQIETGARRTRKRKPANKNTGPRKSSISSGARQETHRSVVLSQSGSTSDHESSASGKSKRRAKLILKINLGASLFDPFDVLPVPGTPQLNVLIKLYKSSCRVNSMAINARNTWWSFISKDAGLMHATLATWALYGMLTQEDNHDFRFEKLRHKMEAIKEINTKIGNTSGKISDELVGTVATLANFESQNLLGAYDAAQLHIAALKRMVKARGGLSDFAHNDSLLRGLLWVDIHTATAFRTPPSFSLIPLSPYTPPLPDALLESAAYTSPTSLLHLSTAPIECFNIFYRLHRLALAISSRWIRKVDRSSFSNLLYEMEYMVLSVPDRSREFLDFDREVGDGEGDECEARAALADAASMIEGLLAAVQIFTYAALREVPPRAPLFNILLERLRRALDRPKANMLEVWSEAKNAHVLLWALVVGASVAQAEGDRSWWVARLWEIAGQLGVRSRENLDGILERVAWTDVVFGEGLGGVWQLVREYGRGEEVRRKCLAQGGDSATPEMGWLSIGL